MTTIMPPHKTRRAEPLYDTWQTRGACRTEDPELFFPVGNAGPARLQAEEAKAVCARCPVREACLQWALEAGQQSGVWGGMTEEERHLLRRKDVHELSNNDYKLGQKLAVSRGDDIVWWLVKRQLSVAEVAEKLNATPRSVYRAWRLIVPPLEERATQPKPAERVINENGEIVRTLHELGRSVEDIAHLVCTSPSVVEVVLCLLQRRDAAWVRLDKKDVQDAVRMAQAAEERVRWEARDGLTLKETALHYAPEIMLLRGQRMTFRQIADELNLSRETVRLAAKELELDPSESPRTVKPAAVKPVPAVEETAPTVKLGPSMKSRMGFGGGQEPFLKGFVAA